MKNISISIDPVDTDVHIISYCQVRRFWFNSENHTLEIFSGSLKDACKRANELGKALLK